MGLDCPSPPRAPRDGSSCPETSFNACPALCALTVTTVQFLKSSLSPASMLCLQVWNLSHFVGWCISYCYLFLCILVLFFELSLPCLKVLFFLVILPQIRHPIPAKTSLGTDKAEEAQTTPSSGTSKHCTSRCDPPVPRSTYGAVWDLIHGPHKSAEALLPLQFALICLFDFSLIAVWHCPYWISSYRFRTIFEIHHFAFEACCPKHLHFDATCKLYRCIP